MSDIYRVTTKYKILTSAGLKKLEDFENLVNEFCRNKQIFRVELNTHLSKVSNNVVFVVGITYEE